MTDEDWLRFTIPLHERLSDAAASLIENVLKKNGMEYLSVTSRTKTIEGAAEKIQRKEYDSPQIQLTDLSGIRIVTYLEEHTAQITKVLRNLFDVDEENSHDRSADLGEDRMGYPKFSMPNTTIGLLRHLMMYYDLDRYFETGRHFDAISAETVRFLETKYPLAKIKGWLTKYKIRQNNAKARIATAAATE